ncbi:metallophosphoesterase [Bacillus sp. AFS031507]|uniref:metallophosphoesterase family protein n=1 Tax=Bacillus sp. AFS031507 TaxID=2033496 RepID=UPI000BFD8B06|nr:metallophosphoesterase [Bacillus sp. AFS031507]PGY08388.1 YfcE family phosphodiesterase [Bacillus sp. AFS031507]
MKIVVLSDTHLPKRAKSLPPRLIEELVNADLIIHAGDWQTIDVYNDLKSYANIVGVYGNVDGDEIKELFPENRVIEVCGFKIGITHGHGTGKTTERRAIQKFADEKVDCIIFGHSHIPIKKCEKGIMLFNPGSPTDKRRQEKYSFGLINIGDSLEAEHIFFTKDSSENNIKGVNKQ